MSHFAILDENNTVIYVLSGRVEDDGKEEQLSAETGQTYKQTSYNTRAGKHLLGGRPFRKNYAGIGYIYDVDRDAFIPPQPSPDHVLNEETCLWEESIE
jgi:hypothetical protein